MEASENVVVHDFNGVICGTPCNPPENGRWLGIKTKLMQLLECIGLTPPAHGNLPSRQP